MKLKKVLSICKANGLYYLYDRIDRSGEITQWLGDGYALYPLDACLFWTKKVSAPCSILPGSNAKKSFSGMSACRNT